MCSTKTLDDIELKHLVRKYKSGDTDVAERIVACHTRLICKIANRYVHPNVDVDDLIQEGTMGLFTALEKFDVSRGVKFTTYATWWIINRIATAADVARYRFSSTKSDREKIIKIANAESDLFDEMQAQPSVDEVVDKSGMSARVVADVLLLSSGVMSLDMESGETSALVDSIGGTDDTPHDVITKESCERIDKALGKLDARTEHMMRSYFGLYDGQCATLADVGRSVGLTRECVRQHIAAGLQKLAKQPEMKGLTRLS